MVLRAPVDADVATLACFYRRLPPADRVGHLGVCDWHDRGFVARVVSVERRGGVALVAEVRPPAGGEGAGRNGHEVPCEPRDVVGEAHVEVTGPGPGRLVVVVDPVWREWLGPRLFAAAVEDAAALGVANLAVDVRRADSWTRHLLEAHGHVVVPTDDWLSARLVVGTVGDAPAWEGTEAAPRVLVEDVDGRWHAAGAARAAGLVVWVCTAPARPRAPCPLREGLPCPLVTGADALVVSYPPARPEWDDLLLAHRRLHPEVPVCVEGVPADRVPPGVTALDVHDPAAVVARVAELAAPRAAARARRRARDRAGPG